MGGISVFVFMGIVLLILAMIAAIAVMDSDYHDEELGKELDRLKEKND